MHSLCFLWHQKHHLDTKKAHNICSVLRQHGWMQQNRFDRQPIVPLISIQKGSNLLEFITLVQDRYFLSSLLCLVVVFPLFLITILSLFSRGQKKILILLVVEFAAFRRASAATIGKPARARFMGSYS